MHASVEFLKDGSWRALKHARRCRLWALTALSAWKSYGARRLPIDVACSPCGRLYEFRGRSEVPQTCLCREASSDTCVEAASIRVETEHTVALLCGLPKPRLWSRIFLAAVVGRDPTGRTDSRHRGLHMPLISLAKERVYVHLHHTYIPAGHAATASKSDPGTSSKMREYKWRLRWQLTRGRWLTRPYLCCDYFAARRSVVPVWRGRMMAIIPCMQPVSHQHIHPGIGRLRACTRKTVLYFEVSRHFLQICSPRPSPTRQRRAFSSL